MAATRGHVLYVEDNPVNSLLMQAMLQQRPEVGLTLASDGSEALVAVRRRRPDLILLDLNLPDGEGAELLVRLRAAVDLRGVPCIAVSAACDDHTVNESRARGFDDFWSKPLRLQNTLAELDRWRQRTAAPAP
jgi:CheY-like chemotaxis protein